MKTCCRICGKEISSISFLNHVPIVDPYASKFQDELVKLVGAPVHVECWAQDPLWQEVARLGLEELRRMFQDGCALMEKEFVSAWIRTPKGSSEGVGTLFLPRSMYVYKNMLGDDVKGGYISGSEKEINATISLLVGLNFDEINAGVLPVREGVTLERIDVNLIGVRLDSGLRFNVYIDDIKLMI